MPLRKPTSNAKKYNGIKVYYKKDDKNKTAIAHQIIYWNGKSSKRERVETTNIDEAYEILQARKRDVSKKSSSPEEFKKREYILNEVATEYFYERQKTGNLEKDKKRYVKHIGDRIYKVIKANNAKCYELTNETDTYEAHLKSGTITRYYERNDNHLTLGGVKIYELNSDHVVGLIGELKRKELSQKTVANIVNLLKAIVNFAIDNSYTTINPFLGKKTKVNVTKEERKRLLTPEERREVFISAKQKDNRLFVLFKMLYFTAQRPKSIIGLRVKDIDLANKLISIDSIKGQSGTSVPISDKLYPILKLWVRDCEPEQKLFDIGYETFQNKAQIIFESLNKGLDFKKDRYRWASMYSFRHTSATVMLSKTGNIKMVQGVLNHSSLKMTEEYAKLIDDSKERGVNVL